MVFLGGLKIKMSVTTSEIHLRITPTGGYLEEDSEVFVIGEIHQSKRFHNM